MMVLGEIISFDKYTFVVMIVLEKYSSKGVNSPSKYQKSGIGRFFNWFTFKNQAYDIGKGL